MAFETLSGGLQLVIPTNGTRNWGTVLRNSTWTKINNHNHTGSGQGVQIPTGGIADDAINEDKILDNVITKQSLSQNLDQTQAATLTPAGTTETVDFNTGNKQILDLSSASGNVTLTLNNPLEGAAYRIKIIQGVTPRVLTWPANVKFPGGEEPSQFQPASDVGVVYLDYDGTDFLANWEIGVS